MSTNEQPALASGTFQIGGDIPVYRLGYGAMQITGAGVWGPPRDHAEAIRVLRRATALGINLIDTADSYGPNVSEELIAEALHPYPQGLLIATKGGFDRTGPNQWVTNGNPAHLRTALEGSLRRLKLDHIDLYQLHRIDDKYPADEQIGVLADMRREGKIRHVGLSEVDVEQIEHARSIVPIATVQNLYNLGNRQHEDVLDYCEREGIGFIPWFPLDTGRLLKPGSSLAGTAERLGATPAQVALAWLLRRSPVMLPIPGTSSVGHLEENTAAATLTLSDADFQALAG
ncbi:oxidoreductase [Chloroflexia bacterium SDU3-3]|nr:oxidoreductase [Chloroflexia bacterium SDU3-3]